MVLPGKIPLKGGAVFAPSQAGPATRGQVKRKARISGQIRSESPGPPEPILAAVHPEPPQRHTHRSVDSRVGVRTRSEQSVTSTLLLPVVQSGPEHQRVVRPCGSQRGSRPHALGRAPVILRPWLQICCRAVCSSGRARTEAHSFEWCCFDSPLPSFPHQRCRKNTGSDDSSMER